jgi:trimethylamine---corrinoid protein Co-methyltransferase
MIKLTILSQKERETVHNAGKQILNEVGVKVRNEHIYKLLLDAGARHDEKDKTHLYFGTEMVKKYLAMCPKSFTIKNRKGEATEIKNGSTPLYYSANATHYIRGTSKQSVEIGKEEFTDFMRVIDKLDNVQGMVGMNLKEPAPRCRDIMGFRYMAENSYKHIRPCMYSPFGAEAMIEMADVILEGKSLRDNMFFTLGYSIVSPLTWSETALELIKKSSGHGIPFMINSEPMVGGTSPVTLAGSLAMADAEVISGLIILQVLEPGRPVIYNAGFAHILDMLTTLTLTAAPEGALLQAAGAEMAEYHGLPCASWALSDAAMLDSQASYEKFLTLMAHTMSNVNLVWGIGNLETSKAISPEVAVIDNELIGNCLRFRKGITVDEEHLALEVIKDTVFKGNFLETEHTLYHYQDEIRYSTLPCKSRRSAWETEGSKSIEEKAKEVVDNILSGPKDVYLTGSQMEKLDKIQAKWIERLQD